MANVLSVNSVAVLANVLSVNSVAVLANVLPVNSAWRFDSYSVNKQRGYVPNVLSVSSVAGCL